MNDANLDIMARKLAIKHIARDVRRGLTESYIAQTWAASGCGQSFVDNTGGDEFGAHDVSIGGWLKDRRINNDKILVKRVCGVEVNKVFSLHELYEECRKGQLSLF